MNTLTSRIDLDVLYPPFKEKYLQLLTNCQKRGATYYAISGLRSIPEQTELYAQGRTKPGKIVTNAKPGTSAHNYSIATDSCRDADLTRAGLQPDWDMPSYLILAEEAVKLGLESAYYWASFKEGPHVQLPLSKHDITFLDLKKLYDHGGMSAVFDHLNKYSW